jgi:uncharacterized protein YxeA
MKRILTVITILAIVSFGAWFLFQRNKNKNGLENPPTAEELKRMEEIEKTSSQIAPDAVAGAGVRPKGTLPKTTEKTKTQFSSTTKTKETE